MRTRASGAQTRYSSRIMPRKTLVSAPMCSREWKKRTSTIELVSQGHGGVSASKTRAGWQTGDLSKLRKPGMELKPQPMFSFIVWTAVKPGRWVGVVREPGNDRLLGFISQAMSPSLDVECFACKGMKASCLSSFAACAITEDQSPGAGCRKRRAVGYQGLSSRSRSQR